MTDPQPGDAVVCVREPTCDRPRARAAKPIKGAVYNVREVTVGENILGEEVVCVRLSQPETQWFGSNGVEGCWNVTLFRRVCRFDSSRFSKLLEPVDLGVRA